MQMILWTNVLIKHYTPSSFRIDQKDRLLCVFFYVTHLAEPKIFVSVEIEMICCVYCHFSIWENAQSNLSTQCDDTEARQQQYNCVFLPFFKSVKYFPTHSAFSVSNNNEWQLLSNAAVCTMCMCVCRLCGRTKCPTVWHFDAVRAIEALTDNDWFLQ